MTRLSNYQLGTPFPIAVLGRRLSDQGLVLPDNTAQSGLDGARLFVVIGAQRTGTNLLREILNTNKDIAMLGEVLSPSAAPAHWDNFCRGLPARAVPPVTVADAEALLDHYFDFVLHRIRNHWEGNKKAHCRAFGVDIKYNQLGLISALDGDSSFPFMVSYLRSRGAILVHTTRNIIHSAISALIAAQRNLWHNYDGVVIDRPYHIDPIDCLTYARSIIQQRDAFISSARGCKLIDCRYENLIDNVALAGLGEEICEGPGPLKNIASALGSSFRFRHAGRLHKAINAPYSKLIANYEAFIRDLKDSELSSLLPTLA